VLGTVVRDIVLEVLALPQFFHGRIVGAVLCRQGIVRLQFSGGIVQDFGNLLGGRYAIPSALNLTGSATKCVVYIYNSLN